MAEFVKVAQAGEVAPGKIRLVELDGRRIALANVGGSCYAFDESCPHRGGPLSEGVLEGEVVTCPWHAGRLNVRTGEVVAPPPRSPVKTYAVQAQGQDILIARP